MAGYTNSQQSQLAALAKGGLAGSSTGVQACGSQRGCFCQVVSNAEDGVGAPSALLVSVVLGAGGEGGVEGVGDVGGEGVADLPEGSHHLWVSDELEGCGGVGCLVGH
jgi:hypothetical protein